MKNNVLTSFFSFVKGPGKFALFTFLFYAIWSVHSLVTNQNFNLESFPQRMIGTATLDAYDVSLRVSLFYKSILLLLVSIGFFNTLAFLIHKKNAAIILSNEIKLINYSSLIGIILFVFRIFEYEVFYSMELVYYIHKLMLLALVLRFVFFKKNQASTQNYALIVLLSFALYFFVADCFNLSGSINNPDFFIVTFILSSILLVGMFYSTRNLDSRSGEKFITKLAYILVPLCLLPFISAAKDELFFIFKNNNILLSDASPFFIALILLLISIIYFRSRNAAKSIKLSQKELIATRYFPLLIFSLITFVHYSHYFFYNDESFESGNKYLPIMEFDLFGVIPTLEKFNSHLLSDYFFNSIYACLNGMGSLNEIELYDFMYIPFSFTLFYMLIYFITRNAYISAFTILLFPFYAAMLPGGYSFSIPAVFALHLILRCEQSIKNYVILFLTVVAIVLWRFDLGYSCMLIVPILLLTYHFIDRDFKIKWPLLLKALGIVLGGIVLFLSALSLYRHVNLFEKSLYILNYFTSAQTYGYTTIGWQNLPSYKMHYFIFPVLVGIIILSLIVNYKTLNVSRKQRLAYLCLFFLCSYYMVNFNRGLIRHSLIEWTDEFTATFLYLILPGSVFVFFHAQKTLIKFILFSLIAFYSLLSFKLPLTTGSISLTELCIKKIQNLPNDTLININNRIKGAPKASENKDKDFLNFMSKNTKPDETFIDFTGSSLLYFSTKKVTPSFFYQNPLCSHNEFLQKHFIDDLKDYKVPYLLFSSVNDNDYDGVDGVPNSLRNYRMAEYFYQTYEPHVVLGRLRIWKKKGLKDLSKIDTIYTYKRSTTSRTSDSLIKTRIKFKTNKKYLLRIKMDSNNPPELIAYHKNESFSLPLYQANSQLYYCILDTTKSYCDLLLKNYTNSCHSFMIMECDYLPDFYSEKFLSYNFRKLPYIWGTYDRELPRESVLLEDKKTILLENELAHIIKLPSNLDKSNGNTLILDLLNKSKEIQTLTIAFGKKGLKNKSSISFSVLPSEKEERYAIRLSSVYKWYSEETNELSIWTEADKNIQVTKLQLTKEK